MPKKLSVKSLYRKFSGLEGNKHIASEFTVYKVKEIISVFKPKHILEVGLGIGSISGIILALNKRNTFKYHGTESNAFCLTALQENLGDNYRRLKIYRNIVSIPKESIYDFIIVDGDDNNFDKLKKIIAEHGIIILEGGRCYQQNLIMKFFPKCKYVHSISLKKNKNYSPFPGENWQGGIKIFFINPTIKQWIWWAKEKLVTTVKYKYPGRYIGFE